LPKKEGERKRKDFRRDRGAMLASGGSTTCLASTTRGHRAKMAPSATLEAAAADAGMKFDLAGFKS
jgi:hypothetical protein